MARPSPIEMMIDRACGVTRPLPMPTVVLRCPHCKTQKMVLRHETDLPGTAVVQFDCPDCHKEGQKSMDVRYFDDTGKEILPT